MSLEQLLDHVTDRTSFFTFVSAPIADREAAVEHEKHRPSSPYAPEGNGWGKHHG